MKPEVRMLYSVRLIEYKSIIMRVGGDGFIQLKRRKKQVKSVKVFFSQRLLGKMPTEIDFFFRV